jgi:hypothetical protein
MSGTRSIGREELFPALRDPRLLVIGYAGRDQAAVKHHIDELAAIGIAPPPHVPMVYELSPGLVTGDASVVVSGPSTSGEVEPVLVRAAGQWYLALGSDHTDRELEATDIKTSKAVCPKPVSARAIHLDGDPARGDLDEAWDAIVIASAIDGTVYQRGTLAALRLPSNLIAHATADDRAGDLVVFCGTVPLLDGHFRYGAQFTATMNADDWSLRLEYAATTPTTSD